MFKITKNRHQEISELLNTKDNKSIEAYAMMVYKVELLESWRATEVPLVKRDNEEVLYPDVPKNPSRFMKWNEEEFSVETTSRAFYHRKVLGVAKSKLDCIEVKKIRARAELIFDYWKNKGRTKLKRNKELQTSRDEKNRQIDINKKLASQLHMLQHEAEVIKRELIMVRQEKEVSNRKNAKLTTEVNRLNKNKTKLKLV